MVILEEIASHFLTFAKMNPIDEEKLKITVETHYKLHKTKGKLHTFTAYKNGGANRDKLIARIRYVLSKYQNELQCSIIKMMDGLPQKLLKAQSEGLNSVL